MIKGPLDLIRTRAGLRTLGRYCLNRCARGIAVRGPPVFIVGCGHSGTSLLLAMLGSHSKIAAIPFESGVGFTHGLRQLARRAMFNLLAVSEGKRRWVEKTPRHIGCIGALLRIYPDAKVILMLRDGRDVACSIQDRGGTIERGIQRWVKDNQAGAAYREHPAVRVLRYEDLVSDPAGALREIAGFLGEDYEESMLEFHKTPRCYYSDNLDKPQSASGADHDQYRNWQINQPLFDGRNRWKRLTEQERAVVKQHANKLLLAYRYIDSEEW